MQLRQGSQIKYCPVRNTNNKDCDPVLFPKTCTTACTALEQHAHPYVWQRKMFLHQFFVQLISIQFDNQDWGSRNELRYACC